jgi:hypothetical protein
MNGRTLPHVAWLRHVFAAFLASCALAAPAAEQDANDRLQALGMLPDLEAFMHQRGEDLGKLDMRAMVGLMVDWHRFSARPGDPGDVLVYRYGGWSEGCATGFKLSLLRRVAVEEGGDAARFAGITFLFEPSGPSNHAPWSTTSAEWKSMEEFVAAVESSPAFRGLQAATPMSVMVESGGLR